MDRGTDAVKMLRGEEVPLNLGYVGVKLRSQQNIRDQMKIKAALDQEKKWFEDHRVYSKLPPGMTGIPALIEKLTKTMFKQIRHTLPGRGWVCVWDWFGDEGGGIFRGEEVWGGLGGFYFQGRRRELGWFIRFIFRVEDHRIIKFL